MREETQETLSFMWACLVTAALFLLVAIIAIGLPIFIAVLAFRLAMRF